MTPAQCQQIIQKTDPAWLIATLKPYLSERRITLIDTLLSHRLTNLQIAIEAPSDVHNVAAVLRTAETQGIDTIHLIAGEGQAKFSPNVTQGARKWVNVNYHDSLAPFLQQQSEQQFILAGACPAPQAYTLETLPLEQPLCLLLGNEHRGLSEQAKAACHQLYTIPMVGMTESLNLSVAAAISLYYTAQRLRQQGLAQGFSAGQHMQRQALFYALSINYRLLTTLIKHKSS